MKYNFFILLAIVSAITCSCQGQKTGFNIKGTLTGNYPETFQTDSIFLYANDRMLTAAPLVNGKFELKGSVTEVQNAAISTRKNGVGRLILENADYTYTCNDNHIIIKGGKLHDMVLGFENGDDEYSNALEDYEKTGEMLYAGGRTRQDFTLEEKQLNKEKVLVVLAIENRRLGTIIKSPEAPVLAKAFAIGRIQDWDNYPVEKRIALLKEYKKESGGSPTVIGILRMYEKMEEVEALQKTVATGKMFKDVSAVDVNGNVVKLSDIIAKNKYTILEFWASWCGPCRGEIPNLKKAYAKFKSKGLEIYAVSIDNKKDKWLKALKEENCPWLSVNDPAGFKGEAVKGYGLSGVPASFLIGQDGKIVVSNDRLRGKELEKTLSEYMP